MVKRVLLVTTSKGLMGTAFQSLRKRTDCDFEIIFPEDFGLTVARNELVEVLEEVTVFGIVHNASHVPRGISDENFQGKSIKNLDLFMKITEIALRKRIKVFGLLSSYQILRPNHRAPFIDFSNDAIRLDDSDSLYVRQKKLEVLNSIELQAESKETKLEAFLLPHLFGPGDKFDSDRAHFVAKMMCRIQNVLNNKEDTLRVEGELETRIQLAFSIDAAETVLSSITEVEAKHVCHAVNRGVNLSLAEVLSEVLKVTGFKGSVEVVSSSVKGGQGNYDLYFMNPTPPESRERFTFRSQLAETWRWYKKSVES